MKNDTIVALSSAAGVGAIALVRLSGDQAIDIVDKVFVSPSKNKRLIDMPSHTAHFGSIMDGDSPLDEVVVTIFHSPRSFTGEQTVEIACHGSIYIQQELLQLLIRRGARMASAGEFTQRAFLNGKMDLSQAEAVADLIESESIASHSTAMNQMRGGYSQKIASLRDRLLDFASLIELELDFSDQDVEFAERGHLRDLLWEIKRTVKDLADSFSLGNVIKNGIPISIVGAPNVGKSTLLNSLLGEERAIVSHIAGTTRDAIEDSINISGLRFRFIDTAGLRQTDDFVEQIGIKKTYQKIDQASVVLYLLDGSNVGAKDLVSISELKAMYPDKHFLVVVNKIDLSDGEFIDFPFDIIKVSASTGYGLDALRDRLVGFVNVGDISNRTIVTNVRHYQAFLSTLDEIERVEYGLNTGVSGDLLAVDVRSAIYYLSSIIGEITEDDVLGNIFSRFCIGK